MSDILNPVVWSETDAANTSTSLQPGWPENMLGNKVNDAARAMQGSLKRFADQINGTRTTAGTGSAYTVDYTVAPESLYNGQRFLVLAHAPCLANPTININSLGAKTIRKIGATGLTNLAANDILINTPLDLAFIAALNQVLWINPPATTAAAAGGSIAWGAITGTITAQTDLNTALTTEATVAKAGSPVNLIATDAGKLVTFAAAAVVNVNTGVFPVGARIDVLQTGTGIVSFGGTVPRVGKGTKLNGQYAGATIWVASASQYVLIGDVVA